MALVIILPVNAKGETRSVLVVCATHEEIGNVTAAIRAERHQAGELGPSVAFRRYVPQNYTTAQKSEPQNFHEGQVLLFHRGTKEIGKNGALEVVRVEKHKIVGRNTTGGERELTAEEMQNYATGSQRQVLHQPV